VWFLDMARPQQYDRQQALDRAKQLFWAQGYEVTSLPELLKVTGLSRSSFYAAFGDKRQLYLEALDSYAKDIVTKLDFVRSCDDPAAAIYHYYEKMLSSDSSEPNQSGCLLVNTLVEFESVDSEIYLKVIEYSSTIDSAFLECFELARSAGKLKSNVEPKTAVRFFAAMRGGVQLQRRLGVSNDELKKVLNMFIESICKLPH
jgi:TetR/AcrR family transcriptional repressor of nem operon